MAGPSVLKHQDNKGPFLRQDNGHDICSEIAAGR